MSTSCQPDQHPLKMTDTDVWSKATALEPCRGAGQPRQTRWHSMSLCAEITNPILNDGDQLKVASNEALQTLRNHREAAAPTRVTQMSYSAQTPQLQATHEMTSGGNQAPKRGTHRLLPVWLKTGMYVYRA